MPVYEYRCPTCDHRFEQFEKRMTNHDDIPCPQCGHNSAERLLSVFNAGSTAPSAPSPGAGCGRCGDPHGPCAFSG